MPFIGRGGSSPPPDTVTRAKAPDSRAFARRVRPVKAARTPVAGFWPDQAPGLMLTNGRHSGERVHTLPAGMAAALQSLPRDVALLVWVADGQARVLWWGGPG